MWRQASIREFCNLGDGSVQEMVNGCIQFKNMSEMGDAFMW